MQINKAREIRFFKKMTLDDLYLLTGRRISQPKLSRIERGIEIPTEEEKEMVAKALKEPVEKIFPHDESEKD